jgi:hypothetical protein
LRRDCREQLTDDYCGDVADKQDAKSRSDAGRMAFYGYRPPLSELGSDS